MIRMKKPEIVPSTTQILESVSRRRIVVVATNHEDNRSILTPTELPIPAKNETSALHVPTVQVVTFVPAVFTDDTDPKMKFPTILP